MHFGQAEAVERYQGFSEFASQEENCPVKVWVAAPFVHLPALQQAASRAVPFGSQNVHFEESGAFTGEISVPMVKDCGGSFSLVGHSERRTLFAESEELLFQRAEGALRQGLKVVYCIGETLDEREAQKTDSVLQAQLSTINELLLKYTSEILIAYEPVWAIGTGKVATVEEIASAHQTVKAAAANVGVEYLPVLYGGSVKPQNIDTIACLPEVDGALVGGASLEVDSFGALFSAVKKSRYGS